MKMTARQRFRLHSPGLVRWLAVLLLGLGAVFPAMAELLALSYHEVSPRLKKGAGFNAMTVETAQLARQFSWLREQGYVSVGIDDLLAAQRGERALPKKAVLLTFDDGYRGMYEQVFPLLELFDFKAVLAVVGSWLDTPRNRTVSYGEQRVPRDHFLTWAQIREMVRSGRVEVASHSYDLHHGIIANPQGNLQPAAVSRRYDPKRGRYESDTAYRQRIRADLRRNSERIERMVGVRPRVMVWPYGAYSMETVAIAQELGMPVTLTLEGEPEKMDIQRLDRLGRLLVGHGANLQEFVWLVNRSTRNKVEPVRVVHLDLDYVYDPDPEQQERNLGHLLDRIVALGVNVVYLQAFADPDGDGNADALYFPNRHLPMRADLFNRVAWQLKTRAEVAVYGWLPVLAFDLPEDHPLAQVRVRAAPSRREGAESYRRLSPFSRKALRFVGDIYEDLAKHAHLDGVLFHDDAYLDDFEDASQWGLATYRKFWGMPTDIDAIRRDPELFVQWSERKTRALAYWTDALAERVRHYRPRIKTARNLYAAVIMKPESERWFAQSLEVFLEHYDFTAVMAMPYMEEADDPDAWLTELVERVASVPGALEKTVFELQSVDWRRKSPIDGAVLAHQMRLLQHRGVLHFGYYPDDFIQGLPPVEQIRPVISLKIHPQGEP